MKSRFILSFIMFLGLCSVLGAQEYKVVIPQLSPATVETYTNLAKAIFDAAGIKATIEVVPFARAIFMVQDKQADMLVSEIENPITAKAASQKFDTSTTPLFQIVFVLYANKAKPVDATELQKGNPKNLVIETDSAHVDFFSFTPVASTAFDASLKKVDAGRIDGYIFAQPSVDATLKNLGLKNITRTFYSSYTTKIILQKGARGGALDKAITSGVEKIKANGTYDTIMGKYVAGASKYIEWQQ